MNTNSIKENGIKHLSRDYLTFFKYSSRALWHLVLVNRCLFDLFSKSLWNWIGGVHCHLCIQSLQEFSVCHSILVWVFIESS